MHSWIYLLLSMHFSFYNHTLIQTRADCESLLAICLLTTTISRHHCRFIDWELLTSWRIRICLTSEMFLTGRQRNSSVKSRCSHQCVRCMRRWPQCLRCRKTYMLMSRWIGSSCLQSAHTQVDTSGKIWQ